jgi:hypothetical protein
MNNAQLTFGLMSGVEKFQPWGHGDILVTKSGRRVVVTLVDDNIDGLVLVGVDLKSGGDVVVLEREVQYRSSRGRGV